MKQFLKISIFSFLLLTTTPIFSKTIVISDIDDTLKMANSMGNFQENAYHFLRKIPFVEMRDLFNEIKNQDETKFYYVSAAYSLTFNAQKWLNKNNFPQGKSILKTLKDKESTYDFKHVEIKQILESEMKSNPKEALHVMMFGDNAQADAMVYSDLTKEMNLNSEIYIRDVRAEATYLDSSLEIKQIPGVKYYFSEIELFKYSELNFVSLALLTKTHESYKNKKLIPTYTLKTLERRLLSIYNDTVRAHDDAIKFWDEYYSRY